MVVLKKKYLIHLVTWLIFLIAGYSVRYVGVPNFKIDVLDILLTEFPNIFLFYFSIPVFLKYLEQKKLWILFVGEIILLTGYLLLFFIIGEYVSPILNPGAYVPPFKLGEFIVFGFWIFLVYSLYSFGYCFALTAIKKERDLRNSEEKRFKLEAEKQQKEQENLFLQKQKLQLENAFLRSQINPHTLHNILNMLYSKSIRADAPELSEAILVLSNLMRYSLESATDANGLVPLEKELEQINNTIKINQLRSSNKFNIDFKVTGDTSQAKIIPLMLITLVENAFKYAELNDEAYPLLLHITLQQSSFVFYMHNKKRTVIVHETSHGIGLENTRQRLKAAYGDDGYAIDIKQDDLHYSFQLTIHHLNKDIIKKESATL